MKIRNQKLIAIMTAGILGVSILGGCSAEQDKNNTTQSESEQSNTAQTESEKTEQDASTDEAGQESFVSVDEDISEDMLSALFRPSDIVWPCQESYQDSSMGVSAVLPEELLQRMDKKEVAMLGDEKIDDDGSTMQYTFWTWSKMTEEQRDAEVTVGGTGYYDWEKSLERIGTLGMYHTDFLGQLDELTGCTEHHEVGSSSDGKYKYYLSINTNVEKELTDEILQIQVTFTEILSPEQIYGSSQSEEENNTAEVEGFETTDAEGVGKFETTDISGNAYTEKIFKDYDLTMVNVFTTWCTPCVQELPDLEKLYKEMADKGVNVVGVVLDAVDEDGNLDEEALEKAKMLRERTGVTYPLLIPDSGNMNGRLSGIQSFPETFFVDKNGNIVGQTYGGSGSLDDWREVVENELANLKGEK